MPPNSPSSITKSLYKKNLELFNANRALALLQKLYLQMANSFTIKDLSQKFIDTITHELDYHSGLVGFVDREHRTVTIIAATKSSINDFAESYTHRKLTKLSIPLNHHENILIKTITTGKRTHSSKAWALWTPLIPTQEFATTVSKSKIYSTLCLPISIGLNTVGVFALSSPRDLTRLTDFELDILPRIASTFNIAVDRASLYQDLKKANRELRHLDKLKDEFVYIATHELKTPVTVMRGYLSMMNDGSYGKLSHKLHEPLNQLSAANAQLIQLVNDLLEIARAEAITLTISTEPVNLYSIVLNTIKSLQTLSKQKRLKLIHTYPTKKIIVKADKEKVKEVLNNLLSNAIKYSEKGSITVSHVIDKDYIVTHIADQGLGISSEDQKKIFTRFFRAEEQAGKIPGTGLGLFIVKQLIEKMGGKIWFSSKLGQGTTFSFSLPKSNKALSKSTSPQKPSR